MQEPNTIELWNKLNFEKEKNGENTPYLKYSVPVFVEQIYIMQEPNTIELWNKLNFEKEKKESIPHI
jgi:DNA-binding transcriptional regulator/RsmH inhibitor MraZ